MTNPIQLGLRDALSLVFNTSDISVLRAAAGVSTQWRDAVGHFCQIKFQEMGVNLNKDEAFKTTMELNSFYNFFLDATSDFQRLEQIRKTLPKIKRIQDLKQFREILIEQYDNPTSETVLDIDHVRHILKEMSAPAYKATAKIVQAAIINTCGNLSLAAEFGNIRSILFFSKYKPSVNEYQDCLLKACCSGSMKVVKFLKENGANPMVPPKEGTKQTYLTGACLKNKEDLAIYLLGWGADTEAMNYQNLTPLAIAAKLNTKLYHVFAEISKPSDFEKPYGFSRNLSLIHQATEGNQIEVIRDLLKRNFNVNATNGLGMTPLMIATTNKTNNLAKELVKLGGDINFTNLFNDWTALHYAVHYDNEKFLKWVLKRNVSATTRANALKFAIKECKPSFIRLLSGSLGINTVLRYGSVAAISILGALYIAPKLQSQ